MFVRPIQAAASVGASASTSMPNSRSSLANRASCARPQKKSGSEDCCSAWDVSSVRETGKRSDGQNVREFKALQLTSIPVNTYDYARRESNPQPADPKSAALSS